MKSRGSIFHGIRANLFPKLIEITAKRQTLWNLNRAVPGKIHSVENPLKVKFLRDFPTPFNKGQVDFGFYQKFSSERLLKLIKGR